MTSFIGAFFSFVTISVLRGIASFLCFLTWWWCLVLPTREFQNFRSRPKTKSKILKLVLESRESSADNYGIVEIILDVVCRVKYEG